MLDVLEDIDWQAGEVLVRGKGGRHERLPLPVDVGQALVDYLTRGRPRRGECRRVFVIHRAPYAGLSRWSEAQTPLWSPSITAASATGPNRRGATTRIE